MSSFKEVLIGLGSSLLSGVFAWHPRRFGLNSPEPPKIGIEAHTRNQSNGEVEVGGSEVQVCPWLCSKFKASFGFRKLSVFCFLMVFIQPKHQTKQNQNSN